jgi:hypothetical protein
MSYQSNLDKLMQMALLEQLNNLVNQINKPISTNTNQHKCDNFTFPQENLQQNILEVIKVYEEHIKSKQNDLIQCSCKDYTNMFEKILTKFDEHIHRFNSVIFRIENKLDELTNMVTASETRFDSLEKQSDRSRGVQQKLTSFTGFAKDSVSHSIVQKEENIILKIEETEEKNETVCEYLKQEQSDNDDQEIEEDEVEEDDNDDQEEETKKTDDQVEHDQVEDDYDEGDEVEVEDDEVEVEDDEVEVEDDEVEVEDDEVEVEDDVKEKVKEEDINAEEEEEEEEEEEGEEVFEIEIDDVTYFATDEENGILYEVDKDGEVGKKVGIIKDGEPIFS